MLWESGEGSVPFAFDESIKGKKALELICTKQPWSLLPRFWGLTISAKVTRLSITQTAPHS